MSMTPREVLLRRLAVQRLSSPGLAHPADVVRLLTCVQSQEHAHALWSLGMRTKASTYAGLQAEFDQGTFLRTHILRPTWHFVAPEDLRWVLAATSPRVEQLRLGHSAKLGLFDAVVRRGEEVLREVLTGRNALTRKAIGVHMAAAGLPSEGLPLGDLLLMNEMRGVIVSGPMQGAQHTHVLVDDVVPVSPDLDRDVALGRLAARFFTGHGPSSVKDLCRWATLTQADAQRGIAVAGDALESVEVDGVSLWLDASRRPRAAGEHSAYLTPVYDEVTLTYPALNFAVAEGHPRGESNDTYIDTYAATVLLDLINVGTWKRTVVRGGVELDLKLAPGVRADLVEAAADRLAAFLGMRRI